MSCPVHASTITSTGAVFGGRVRLKGINYVTNGTAGSIVVRNGGASGVTVLNVATPATTDAYDVVIPDDGILCETSVHATLTNVTSATFFYE